VVNSSLKTNISNDISQRTAARVTGVSLLVLMITGMSNIYFVSPGIIIPVDAVRTAHNIVSSETVFRFSIVLVLIMFNCDVIEALSLYVLLKPVNKSLALLGSFWRLGNAFIGGSFAISNFYILRLAARADYLAAFDTKQSQSLMMFLSITMRAL